MNVILKAELERLEKKRNSAKRWRMVVISLCAAVALGTSYILINPAQTAQQETYCGFEEHAEHTDDCYEKVLVCELPEEGHAHSADCWEEQQVLTCTLPETDGHVHSEACYGTEEYLSCTLEETDGHQHGEACYAAESVLVCENADPEHVHGDECYEQREVLVCGENECEAHHHDENCYSTREVLICGEEETPAHHHDGSCYALESVCVCGMEESEPHEHGEDCYEIDREHLICDLPIHEHTLQCFSDPEADVETSAIWKRTFERVELTGNWNEDVIAIAKTQLGYAESTANYEVQADGTTMKGYTRYGAWYGVPYGDWCAMFCSFCMNYAEVDSDLIPFDSSCTRWIEKLSDPELDLYHLADNRESDVMPDASAVLSAGGYIPVPGDLIFFDNDRFDPEHPEDRKPDHVGFVLELVCNEETHAIEKIKTLEGNAGDAVCSRTYDWTDSSILGFGELPVNPDYVEPYPVPDCDCGVSGTDLISHNDNCARKTLVRTLCAENSAEELRGLWKRLPEDVSSFALTYLGWTDNGKLAELNSLLASDEIGQKAEKLDRSERAAADPAEDLSVPECDCASVTLDLISHNDNCARKAFVRALCEDNGAEDLLELWKQLPEDVSSFALTYMSWTDSEKLAELNALLASFDSGEPEKDAENDPKARSLPDSASGPIYVVAASDFQDPSTSGGKDYSVQSERVQNILSEIGSTYGTAYGFLAGGDYNYDMANNSSSKTQNGVNALKTAVTGVMGSDVRMVLVSGNHDAEISDLSSTGAHDTDYYGVYAIAQSAYPQRGGTESGVQATADGLSAYLEAKADAGYDKPVFIVTHVPLHYSTRCKSDGDAKYASLIFDAISEYGDDLNIFFLYGHDHANGNDDYLGGTCVFLTRGDTINIADKGSTTSFTARELNFTYMNCGFVGYFWDNYNRQTPSVADSTLNMSVFCIEGNTVTVSRWTENGQYAYLKSAGVAAPSSASHGAEVCPVTTNVYASPYVVSLPGGNTDPEQTEKTVTAADGDYTGTITGSLPGDATAELQSLDESEKELVAAYLKDKLGDLGGSVYSGAVDIALSLDGKKLDLNGETVTVTVGGFDLGEFDPADLQAKVYHLKNTDAADPAELADLEPEIEVLPASVDENGNIVFETDSFSVFYFTVDFHYSGKTVILTGGESMLLSDLFARLGIPFDPAQIDTVEFSDPALLDVVPVYDSDGVTVIDWELVSLAPFNSNESLRVTLLGGQTVEISVTDAQALTSVSDGDKVLLQVWQQTKYYLTDTRDGTMLHLTDNVDEATVWTVTEVNGVLVLKSGNNFVTLGNGTAGLGTSNRPHLSYNSSGGFWEISMGSGSSTYYLNQYGGTNYNVAAGYSSSGTNDPGSRWNVLAATETDPPEETETTYWVQVYQIRDTSANYMIVNENSGKIIGVNGSGGLVTQPSGTYLTRVKDSSGNNTEYYTSTLGNEYWWNFSAEGTSSKQTNAAHPTYGLSLTSSSNPISSSPTTNTLTQPARDSTTPNKRWTVNSGNYYLRNSNGSVVSGSSGGNDNRTLIYMQVEPPPTSGSGTGGAGGIIIPPLVPKEPDHRKYIDALRDNSSSKDNPDTDVDDNARNYVLPDGDDVFDLYRQYLDVGPESSRNAVDVLFIIDSSTSMYNDFSGNSDGGSNGYDAKDIMNHDAWRCWALDTLLNGENATDEANVPGYSAAGNNNRLHQRNLRDNGLIGKLKEMNPDNMVAVARFSATSAQLLDWTPAGEITQGITYNNVQGTNYVAGLQEAEKFLKDSEVADDGNRKVMIFLSDGLPTRFYNHLDTNPSTTPGGSGAERVEEQIVTAAVIDEFKDEFSEMIDSGELEIYTIGVGTWPAFLLERLSTDGTAYTSTNFADIMKVIDSKLTLGCGHYTIMDVGDELSDYVDFYRQDDDLADPDLDFVIQKVPVDDNGDDIRSGIVTLYENGHRTTEGERCIESEDDVSVDFDNKTVRVKFTDKFEQQGGYIYRIAFNVKTTQEAYDEYAENVQDGIDGYGGVTGDINGDDLISDYHGNGNTTSSGKPGFHSNDEATLKYKQFRSGEEATAQQQTAYFDHPVIQVNTIEFEIEKIWDDEENHDDDSITATLYMHDVDCTVDSSGTCTCGTGYPAQVGSPVTIDASTDWKYTFEDLPKNHSYTVIEASVSGYTATYVYSGYQAYVPGTPGTPGTEGTPGQDAWDELISTNAVYLYTADGVKATSLISGNSYKIGNADGTAYLSWTSGSSKLSVSAEYSDAATWSGYSDGTYTGLTNTRGSRGLYYSSGSLSASSSYFSPAILNDNGQLFLNWDNVYVIYDGNGFAAAAQLTEEYEHHDAIDPVPGKEPGPADPGTPGSPNTKVVITNTPADVDLELWKVDMSGNLITTGTAKFELYADEDLTDKLGTYTTSGGKLTIEGLEPKKSYWLLETQAPPGFLIAPGAQEFSVAIGGAVTGIDGNAYFDWNEDDHALLFYNSSGYVLPETGGIGTLPIYALGAVLVAVSLMFGYKLRRKRERRAE